MSIRSKEQLEKERMKGKSKQRAARPRMGRAERTARVLSHCSSPNPDASSPKASLRVLISPLHAKAGGTGSEEAAAEAEAADDDEDEDEAGATAAAAAAALNPADSRLCVTCCRTAAMLSSRMSSPSWFMSVHSSDEAPISQQVIEGIAAPEQRRQRQRSSTSCAAGIKSVTRTSGCQVPSTASVWHCQAGPARARCPGDRRAALR